MSLYIYVNSLTSAQSAPTTLHSFLLLLSNPATNPRVVSLQTPIYLPSYNGEWRTVAADPILAAAASLYYYQLPTNQPSSPTPVSELSRLMKSSTISGLTKICLVAVNAAWRSLAESNDLRCVLQTLSPQTDDEEEEEESSTDAARRGSTDAVRGATFDQSLMTFTDPNAALSSAQSATVDASTVDDEFKSFLSSTAGTTVHQAPPSDDEEDPSYESDGGTLYIDVNGCWVAEDDLPSSVMKERKKKAKKLAKSSTASSSTASNAASSATASAPNPNNPTQSLKGEGRKRKKASNFSAKNSAKWVYVTNLPLDATEAEVAAHFSKAGVIEIDVKTQQPRVKLYRDKETAILKGDGSVCFAMPESVSIALSVLDGSSLRADPNSTLTVTSASFQQKGSQLVEKAAPSLKQRKVAQLAAKQAMSWDDGGNGRLTGGIKGLTIVVLKNLFTLAELTIDKEDTVLQEVQDEIVKICADLGSIEKITVFSKHPEGVAIVKFKEVEAATECLRAMSGRANFRDAAVALPTTAHYWDGETDYTNRNAKEEEKEEQTRLDAFGEYLSNQEVPDEFKVRTE